MVDLHSQYLEIREDINNAIEDLMSKGHFIGGTAVNQFAENLSEYLDVKHVIPCANGTDALQIALMALDLNRGDEVIVPAFTYVATAEVIALLGLTPIIVDVDPKHFNITYDIIESYITDKTKVIIPVHLFGQSSDMGRLCIEAKKRGIYIIEDNAQSIGANYIYNNGVKKKTGTIGHIGCLSFYPSKNLGAYGDGGAVLTNDDGLAARIKSIANHGQVKRYYHDLVGCNSRLDAIQAAILSIKLKKLDDYISRRNIIAENYDIGLKELKGVVTPQRANFSTHVFHQYTLIVENGKRDDLKQYLSDNDIPSMIYYPVPLYQQKAYEHYVSKDYRLQNIFVNLYYHFLFVQN
jgi:dTDP-4-amino-4,6-dideoxygalactose transaminase